MNKSYKILLSFLICLCGYYSFAQAPYVRSSPVLTPEDSRLRAILTFGIPITNDTTLNGGLDSLGSMIYSKLYHTVFVRDTNLVGGAHVWTNMLTGGVGIHSLNGLTGSSQTFAIGNSGSAPNIVSSGTVHTFNFPIASSTNTGILASSDFISFANKLNTSDTAAMLGNYIRNIVLNLPSNTFSTPVVYSLASHVSTGNATFNNQSNNTFLAGPSSGGVGAVSWRTLVNNDLPLSSVSPGSYTNSNVTVNQQGIVTSIANGSGGGGGSGTVTFIGMSVPVAFAVSPSSTTTSATFAITAVGNTGQYVNGAGGLTVFPNIPAAVNLTCVSGCTVGGTFPNINLTITSSGGTLTNFSAGNLSPLFTSSVATSTTTPALTFSLTNQSAYTLFGDNTGSTAAPTFFSPSLTGGLFQNEGTTTTLLHGNAAGLLSFSAVSLVNDVTGNLAVSHLNGGTGATSSTFWRGDGTWAAVSGSGTVTSVGVLSTDLSVSGSPITSSGNFTLNINTNAVTYGKFQQVAASSLVGNATGSLANATGIQLGYGLAFIGSKLVLDTAHLADTIVIRNLGSSGDSLGYIIGGNTLGIAKLKAGTYMSLSIGADSSITINSTGANIHGTAGNLLYLGSDGSAPTVPITYDSAANQFISTKQFNITSAKAIVGTPSAGGYGLFVSSVSLTNYNYYPVLAVVKDSGIVMSEIGNTYAGGPGGANYNGSAGNVVYVSQDSADAFTRYLMATPGTFSGFNIGVTSKFGKHGELAIAYKAISTNNTFYGSKQVFGIDSIGQWRYPLTGNQNVDTPNWKPLVMDVNGNVKRSYGWAGGGGSTPTLQQVITAGSVLTTADNINYGTNVLTLQGSSILTYKNATGPSSFGAVIGGASGTYTWQFGFLTNGTSFQNGGIILDSFSNLTLTGNLIPSGNAVSIGTSGAPWASVYTEGGISPGVMFTQTNTVTVANSTSATTLVGTGTGTSTIPASFLVAGRSVRIKMAGVFGLLTATPGTLTVSIKLGSTTIATGVINNFITTAPTNQSFDIEATLTCRTTGASGTVMIDGQMQYENNATSLSPRSDIDLNNAGSTTTVNTTISNKMDVIVQWSSASTSNTISSTIYSIEILN